MKGGGLSAATCGKVNRLACRDNLHQQICLLSIRRHGIEEDVERSDLPVSNDNNIHARIVEVLAPRTRAPVQPASVMESLSFADRRISKMRVRRAKVSSELVERVVPNECTRWHIQYAVVGIKFFDGRATTRCIAFTENLLKVAIKQFMGAVGHTISPW